MKERKLSKTILSVFVLITLPLGIGLALGKQAGKAAEQTPQARMKQRFVMQAKRKEAAARFRQFQNAKLGAKATLQALPMDPTGIPHYFGPFPNYAYSPLPKGPVASIVLTSPGSGYTAPMVTITDLYGTNTADATATAVADPVTGAITSIIIGGNGADYTAPVVSITDAGLTGSGAAATASITPAAGTGIRKFIDPLPGIRMAVPDTVSYPGSDYYEISLREYNLQMHPDLLQTRLRGYVQTNPGTDSFGVNTITPPAIAYLGPTIVSQRDRPVRIKFTNELPTGNAGNLFIPVDTTLMGAGMAPDGGNYSENRAVVHLHGNNSAWISDGTPHQWITPAGESPYREGVSVQNVPDMWYDPVSHNPVDAGAPGATNDPGPGSVTLYYTNAQSARLMFYHDHALGITRLNVYVGMAAGYLITDALEQDMINGTNVTGINPTGAKVLPGYGIPLIIQDKTFVDADAIGGQDPTWKWGSTPTTPHTGDLWFPHVYMPNQNPDDPSGMNAFGRWHYGPWFWPPATGITHGPVANEYYNPVSAPWEPRKRPDTPNPSTPGEAFMDTPVVNGAVYPYLDVDPKAYRFRILNAANDRFFNLQFYEADPSVVTVDGRTDTEVRMVPAVPTAGFPGGWPTDGREGGVPDPATAGPEFIQIGTEGGFLPAPVVLPNQPVDWNMDQTNFDMGLVNKGTLILGTAERADVIVDFSAYAGKTLILYNDSPAPFPAIDPRYDYYTGNPDLTDIGGTPSTQPGFGPNTRTIMQIRVRNVAADPAYNLAKLNAVFADNGSKPGVFETSQDPIIVPQASYNSAYNMSLPADPYVRIHETTKTFTALDGRQVTPPMEPKAIQDEMGEAFDTEYGRMSAMLGLELPASAAGAQNFMLYPYASPPVEIIRNTTYGVPIDTLGDGTQLWRITHNGVDTHTIHVHLFNAQIINRVAWDNAIRPPDPNELGWKETFRVNPLQDTILALRPSAPTNLPFQVPNNIRPIDPTQALGAPLMPPLGGFKDPNGNPVTVTNHLVNMGWEYVYHCHLLAHEEMDMMHAVLFAVAPEAPSNFSATLSGNGRNRSAVLTWTDNSINETSFTVQRATEDTFMFGLTEFTVGPDVTTYSDTIGNTNTTYHYRVYASNTVGDTATPGFPTETMHSPFSNSAGVNLPPAAPSNVLANALRFNGNFDRVTLTWTDGSTNETGFEIQRATNDTFTTGLTTASVNANVVTYTTGNLPRGATYYFRIRAVNASGVSAWVNAAPFPVVTP